MVSQHGIRLILMAVKHTTIPLPTYLEMFISIVDIRGGHGFADTMHGPLRTPYIYCTNSSQTSYQGTCTRKERGQPGRVHSTSLRSLVPHSSRVEACIDLGPTYLRTYSTTTAGIRTDSEFLIRDLGITPTNLPKDVSSNGIGSITLIDIMLDI